MTDLFRHPPRKTRSNPSLAEYLAEPERFPTVRGRPYPNVNPMGAVGQAPDLAAILAQPEDPLGPPMTEPGARDVRTPGMAFGALTLPSAPPMPAPPEPLPERRGLEPMSAPGASGTDLDAEWAAALQRAQQATMREQGYGMQSPAIRAARGMMPAGRPPRTPSPIIAALINSPFGDFVNRHGAPGIARRQAQARAPVPPTRRTR